MPRCKENPTCSSVRSNKGPPRFWTQRHSIDCNSTERLKKYIETHIIVDIYAVGKHSCKGGLGISVAGVEGGIETETKKGVDVVLNQ